MPFKKHKISGPATLKQWRDEQEEALVRDWKKELSGRDLRTLRKRKPKRFLKILFLLLLIVGLFFVLVFFVFNLKDQGPFLMESKNEIQEAQGLKIEIQGPEELRSGDELNFAIIYTNLSQSLLNDMELILRYPEGFNFISSTPIEPENASQTIWALGSLSQGESKKIEIKGQIFGKEEEKEFYIQASYKPVNFHSRFKKEQKYKVNVKASALALEIIGPKNLLKKQPVNYKIRFDNNADSNISDTILEIFYPAGCSYSPESQESEEVTCILQAQDFDKQNIKCYKKDLAIFESPADLICELAHFNPKTNYTIVLAGNMQGLVGQLKELKANIGIREGSKFELQNQAVLISPVIAPEAGVDIAIGDSNSSKEAELPELSFGDQVKLTVKLNNLSSLYFEDLVLNIKIQDPQTVIILDSVKYTQNQAGILTSEDDASLSVAWGTKGSDSLVDLMPGDTQEISFQFDLIRTPLDIEAEQAKIIFQAELIGYSDDLSVPVEWQGSREVKVELSN